eukprot:g266.t1
MPFSFSSASLKVAAAVLVAVVSRPYPESSYVMAERERHYHLRKHQRTATATSTYTGTGHEIENKIGEQTHEEFLMSATAAAKGAKTCHDEMERNVRNNNPNASSEKRKKILKDIEDDFASKCKRGEEYDPSATYDMTEPNNGCCRPRTPAATGANGLKLPGGGNSKQQPTAYMVQSRYLNSGGGAKASSSSFAAASPGNSGLSSSSGAASSSGGNFRLTSKQTGNGQQPKGKGDADNYRAVSSSAKGPDHHEIGTPVGGAGTGLLLNADVERGHTGTLSVAKPFAGERFDLEDKIRTPTFLLEAESQKFIGTVVIESYDGHRFGFIAPHKAETHEEWKQDVVKACGGIMPPAKVLQRKFHPRFFFHYNSCIDADGRPPAYKQTVKFHIRDEYVRKHGSERPTCVEVERIEWVEERDNAQRDLIDRMMLEHKDEIAGNIASVRLEMNKLHANNLELSTRVDTIEKAQTEIGDNVKKIAEEKPTLQEIKDLFLGAEFIKAFQAAGAATQDSILALQYSSSREIRRVRARIKQSSKFRKTIAAICSKVRVPTHPIVYIYRLIVGFALVLFFFCGVPTFAALHRPSEDWSDITEASPSLLRDAPGLADNSPGSLVNVPPLFAAFQQSPSDEESPSEAAQSSFLSSLNESAAAQLSPRTDPSSDGQRRLTGSPTESEYDFEAELPAQRPERPRHRQRNRRQNYEINLLGYNGCGVGESEVMHTRSRIIGGEHRSSLGPAPPIDAALGSEVFYNARGPLSAAYGKGHVRRQVGAEDYEVFWVNGASITVYNQHWRDAIRAGKFETWGSDRVLALRLPRVSLLSAYAPALTNDTDANETDWYQFQQRLSTAVDWGRRVTKGERSIFPATNRPLYSYNDNVGCIGDPDSRTRRGYAGATTGKHGLPETNKRGLYALLLHDQARMVCANNLFQQPAGVCPWGGNYPEGRATHFSRLLKRWRELDVWWCCANSTDRVKRVATVDLGLGTDHLQKLITADVELQWQKSNTTRRNEKQSRATVETADGIRPPPWKPLWRASPEAKFEFSRNVENAIRERLAAPEDDKPLLTEIPQCLRYFRPTLERSSDKRLDAYNRSHNTTHRKRLCDEWAWTRWQMRKWPADSQQHEDYRKRNETAYRKLKDFEQTQRSDFNVDEHCTKQRKLKQQKRGDAFAFDPDLARQHFQKVADNPVIPQVDVIRDVVSPLPTDDVGKLCEPFTGAELRAAVHATNKISRQSDRFGDDVQLYRALDVEAWDAVADLVNPSWQNGFDNLSEGLEADLLHAVVLLHYKGKGDERALDNYRGLVNKTILSKVITAALARRFESALEKNGLYSPSQNGFRKGIQGVELIFVVRRMAEDLRLLFGAESEIGKLCALLQADVQKAYPSFPFTVFTAMLEALGLQDSNYLKAVTKLHLGTRYRVQTAAGFSQEYTLSSGFGEGDRRSPSDFAASYEVCIEVFRRILANADTSRRSGLRLYAPRAPLAVESRRDILRRAHPRSTDLLCVECVDLEYADDTSFPGTVFSSLTQYAAWQEQGSMTGIRDNANKTDFALLSDPAATASNRFLGNWIDTNEDTSRRCAKMAYGLYEMSCISGAAANATEMRVNTVSRVRSRGTFGCETRCWSDAEIARLQRYENDALLMLIGKPRWSLYSFEKHQRIAGLRSRYRVEPLAAFIRYMQCSFFGHLVRLPEHRVARQSLFGVFAAPDVDGYLQRHWLSQQRPGRERDTLWSQVRRSVSQVCGGEIDDKTLVALASDRDLWRTVITEMRIKMIIDDYATDADLTAADISAARLYWLGHFLSAGVAPGLNSFSHWCSLSKTRPPTFAACSAGEELQRAYEEVCTDNDTRCRCAGGCGFTAAAGEEADARFTSWQEETEWRFDCEPVPRIDDDAAEFGEHPATQVERHEVLCTEVGTNKQGRWHVAPAIPALARNDSVRDR